MSVENDCSKARDLFLDPVINTSSWYFHIDVWLGQVGAWNKLSIYLAEKIISLFHNEVIVGESMNNKLDGLSPKCYVIMFIWHSWLADFIVFFFVNTGFESRCWFTIFYAVWWFKSLLLIVDHINPFLLLRWFTVIGLCWCVAATRFTPTLLYWWVLH